MKVCTFSCIKIFGRMLRKINEYWSQYLEPSKSKGGFWWVACKLMNSPFSYQNGTNNHVKKKKEKPTMYHSQYLSYPLFFFPLPFLNSTKYWLLYIYILHFTFSKFFTQLHFHPQNYLTNIEFLIFIQVKTSIENMFKIVLFDTDLVRTM